MVAALLAKELRPQRAPIPIVDNKVAPQSLEDIDRTAQYIAQSGMYGEKIKGGGFRPYNRFECAAIIACGRRFGFDPWASMEQIALIRNKTCVWGKGVRGAIYGSGKCADWSETWENLAPDGACTDKTVATVRGKRKDMPTWFEASFSVREAKLAKLWGSAGPWSDYPANQLLWRAVGFLATRAFGDVMMGVAVAEEVLDTPTEGEAQAHDLQTRIDAVKD